MSRNLTGCFATAKYRGGVRRTEGLNKIIRNRGNISKYQHPTSVHRRWNRGSARKARGLSLQKHNTLSFSILHRRDRNVAIVKNFIAKIHVYPRILHWIQKRSPPRKELSVKSIYHRFQKNSIAPQQNRNNTPLVKKSYLFSTMLYKLPNNTYICVVKGTKHEYRQR